MGSTVALIVVGAAIIVFFSDEFVNLFKKAIEIRVVKLLVPLFILSWLFVDSEAKALSAVALIAGLLNQIYQGLIYFLPKNVISSTVCQIIDLWILTILPGWILDAWSMRYQFKHSSYVYILNAILWILLGSLLVV